MRHTYLVGRAVGVGVAVPALAVLLTVAVAGCGGGAYRRAMGRASSDAALASAVGYDRLQIVRVDLNETYPEEARAKVRKSRGLFAYRKMTDGVVWDWPLLDQIAAERAGTRQPPKVQPAEPKKLRRPPKARPKRRPPKARPPKARPEPEPTDLSDRRARKPARLSSPKSGRRGRRRPEPVVAEPELEKPVAEEVEATEPVVEEAARPSPKPDLEGPEPEKEQPKKEAGEEAKEETKEEAEEKAEDETEEEAEKKPRRGRRRRRRR